MAIGNTGCGKSTMLNSLIHGSEFMEEVITEVPVGTKKPGTTAQKKKKVKVIDVKHSYKCDDNYYFFGIGHS